MRERTNWQALPGELDIAFQPIINIHTGYCFGYEALVRGWAEAGFSSVHAMLDACALDGVLAEFDIGLCRKAIGTFARLPHRDRVKLFLNLDNRTIAQPDLLARCLEDELARQGVRPGTLVLEISERQALGLPEEVPALLANLKRPVWRLALDDFGTGYSGLQTLYFAQPDVVKIDRFFVAGAATDPRKKLFLAQIANMAHLLGITVAAEGVETEREYFVCKEIGCDLIQGYMVQPPARPEQLCLYYPHIEALSRRDRRRRATDEGLIREQIELIDPIPVEAEMAEVFDRFRADKDAALFPVVDTNDAPLGVVREVNLKDYAYSLYGRDLLSNKRYGRGLRAFITPCAVADINAPAEAILQTFAAGGPSSDGILIVENMRYVGFLGPRALLKLINEKNLQAARDQNPLTRLPGNNRIHDFVTEALADTESAYVLVYFDFDNFKPFNDRYGFRLGDRAILLFAEILSKRLTGTAALVGHVGGDDFFAGFRDTDPDACLPLLREVMASFRNDVESFYDEEARKAGCITGVDRDGTSRRFPLLRASAAVLALPPGRAAHASEDLSLAIARLKKQAKESLDNIWVETGL